MEIPSTTSRAAAAAIARGPSGVIMIANRSCRAASRKWRANAKSIRSIPFGVRFSTRVASLVMSNATGTTIIGPSGARAGRENGLQAILEKERPLLPGENPPAQIETKSLRGSSLHESSHLKHDRASCNDHAFSCSGFLFWRVRLWSGFGEIRQTDPLLS